MTAQYRPFEHALIDAVRKRPVLYDLRLQDYKDGVARDKAWEEILQSLEELGFQVNGIEQLCKRWKSLRDRYIRLKKVDQMKKMGSGFATLKRPKWPHFNMLRFLDGYAKKQTLTQEVCQSQDSSSLVCKKELSPRHGASVVCSPASSSMETSSYLSTEGSPCPSAEISIGHAEEEVDDSGHHSNSDHTYLPFYVTQSQQYNQASKRVKLRHKRNNASRSSEVLDRDIILNYLQFISGAFQQTIKAALKPQEEKTTEIIFGQFVGKTLQGMETEKKNRKMQEITSILLS